MKEKRIEFVSGDEATKVLEPTDGSFNLPSFSISSKSAAVLFGGADPAAAMRADQLDVACRETVTQFVAVSGFVIDELVRNVVGDSRVEQSLDEGHLCAVGCFDIDGKRETIAVGEGHNLGALAAFGLPNEITPFFAEANVPSANPSVQSILPFRSSASSSRRNASSQTSSHDQSANRRQQVAYDGKREGRSFHRAPLRSTHKIPSKQALELMRGRPPLGPTGSSGNKSAISAHCSSVSSDSNPFKSESILDPVIARDRFDIEVSFQTPIRKIHIQCLASEIKFCNWL